MQKPACEVRISDWSSDVCSSDLHPGRYKYSPLQFNALFDEFLQCGGVGIEVTTGSHTADEARHYAGVGRRYGFLASRGSDFHSPSESRADLGSLPALPDDLKPVWHDWL